MNKKSLAVALATVAALALFVAPAIGHKKAYDVSIQLKADALTPTTTQFSGKINSTKGGCVRGRTVTITTGAIVLQAVSDGAGNYTTVYTGTPPPQGQDIVASVAKKFLKRNSKHKHKCKSASIIHKAPKPVT